MLYSNTRTATVRINAVIRPNAPETKPIVPRAIDRYIPPNDLPDGGGGGVFWILTCADFITSAEKIPGRS